MHGSRPTGLKICGITCVEDALSAVDLGANAIGLNFWPGSKRVVTVRHALPIVSAIRAHGAETRIVGVFVDAAADGITATRDALGLDLVQLHGDETPAMRDALGETAFKAIRLDGREALDRARTYGGPHVLVDASVPGIHGGTGVRADWGLAAELARERPVWLAGGITPENAVEAIRAVRPAWLDVASGVETARDPRRKDPERMRLLTVRMRAFST